MICVNYHKTFGEKERPVWVGSHFPKEVWLEYIRLMNMGATIRAIVEALGINVTTAFYWRHKILNALKDGKSDAVLEEHTQDDLDAVYAGHLGESVILVTDASTVARKYAEDKELPIIQLKSKTESRQGKYNLQKVNNLHSSLKQDLRGYNGVSTKYLENYANLTIFKQETPRHHSHNKGNAAR